MFDRIRAAIQAGRDAVTAAEFNARTSSPVPPPQENPRRSSAGQRPNAAAGIGKAKHLGLLILDETGLIADRMRRDHMQRAKGLAIGALCVLGPRSELDFDRGGLAVDLLPDAATIGAALGERPEIVERYVIARLFHILDRWGVDECYYSGETASALVRAIAVGRGLPRRAVRFRAMPDPGGAGPSA